MPTKRNELPIYLKYVLKSTNCVPTYFNNSPEQIDIIGRLSEYIKEDIYANPNMPSFSFKRYKTCKNGDKTANIPSIVK